MFGTKSRKTGYYAREQLHRLRQAKIARRSKTSKVATSESPGATKPRNEHCFAASEIMDEVCACVDDD